MINSSNNKNSVKMLPLFGTPINTKIKRDQMINKYNLEILKPQIKFNSKIITLSNILGLYLKGLNKYNKHLNNFVSNFNKIELILHLKKDNFYKLNLRLSNLLSILDTSKNNLIPTQLLEDETNPQTFSTLNLIQKLFIKNLHIKDVELRRKLINEIITKDFPFIVDISNNKEILKHRLNLFEIVASSLITINLLNSKILEKRNKIKLLKYLNILSSNYNNNNKKIKNVNLMTVPTNQTNNSDNLNSSENKLSSLTTVKGLPLNQEKETNLNTFISYLDAQINLDKNIIKNEIVKLNQIKIKQTIKSIEKINEFNPKNYSIPVQNSPVSIFYNNNLSPILNQYLKSMSIFNMKSKGIIIVYSKIIGFNFNSETNKLKTNIYNFLAASFYSMYCLISKPVFVITPDKIIIQLFYYLFIPNLFKFKIRNRNRYKNRNINRNRNYRYSNKYKYRQIKKNNRKIFRKLSNINLIQLFPNKFKKLCEILSRLFKKPIELDLIRLHYPYNDSNILVNLLGIMINKIKVRIIIRKLFRKAIIKNPNKIARKNKVTIIPAFLSGMKIRIAGRLLTHKVVPRQTVKTTRRGALARGKVNFSDVARLTKKNKRGAFSITVSSGQNYN